MKLLRRTQFGNPVLRQVARRLTDTEIKSPQIQALLSDMRYTLEKRRYGVGLAAPQVGHSLAISVIATKPTPTRPEIKRQELTLINPEIVRHQGRKKPMWEGCISGPELYGQAMRLASVRLRWQDAQAHKHEQTFTGFMAQVIQHEVDHLQGVLFVDKVVDTKSYMTFTEYKKMQAGQDHSSNG